MSDIAKIMGTVGDTLGEAVAPKVPQPNLPPGMQSAYQPSFVDRGLPLLGALGGLLGNGDPLGGYMAGRGMQYRIADQMSGPYNQYAAQFAGHNLERDQQLGAVDQLLRQEQDPQRKAQLMGVRNAISTGVSPEYFTPAMLEMPRDHRMARAFALAVQNGANPNDPIAMAPYVTMVEREENAQQERLIRLRASLRPDAAGREPSEIERRARDRARSKGLDPNNDVVIDAMITEMRAEESKSPQSKDEYSNLESMAYARAQQEGEDPEDPAVRFKWMNQLEREKRGVAGPVARSTLSTPQDRATWDAFTHANKRAPTEVEMAQNAEQGMRFLGQKNLQLPVGEYGKKANVRFFRPDGGHVNPLVPTKSALDGGATALNNAYADDLDIIVKTETGINNLLRILPDVKQMLADDMYVVNNLPVPEALRQLSQKLHTKFPEYAPFSSALGTLNAMYAKQTMNEKLTDQDMNQVYGRFGTLATNPDDIEAILRDVQGQLRAAREKHLSRNQTETEMIKRGIVFPTDLDAPVYEGGDTSVQRNPAQAAPVPQPTPQSLSDEQLFGQ